MGAWELEWKFQGALFWDYSGIGIHRIGGIYKQNSIPNQQLLQYSEYIQNSMSLIAE